MELSWLSKFLRGRKCIFCGNNQVYRLKDHRIKCQKCHKKYSLGKIKTDFEVLKYFGNLSQ